MTNLTITGGATGSAGGSHPHSTASPPASGSPNSSNRTLHNKLLGRVKGDGSGDGTDGSAVGNAKSPETQHKSPEATGPGLVGSPPSNTDSGKEETGKDSERSAKRLRMTHSMPVCVCVCVQTTEWRFRGRFHDWRLCDVRSNEWNAMCLGVGTIPKDPPQGTATGQVHIGATHKGTADILLVEDVRVSQRIAQGMLLLCIG